MVVIKTSGNIKDIKGSLGESIFSSNKGTCYIRSKGKTHSNPQSQRQSEHRGAISKFSKLWNDTLTQAQRDAWEQYAKTLPEKMSGFNAFLKLNVNYKEYMKGATGITEYSLSLDATAGCCCRIPNGLNLMAGKSTYSVELWFKVTTLNKILMSYAVSGNPYIHLLSDGTLQWYSGAPANTAAGVIQINTKYHIFIGRRADGSCYMYVNGVDKFDAGTALNYLNAPGDILLGKFIDGNETYNINGFEDEVRFYDSDQEAQVAAQWNGGNGRLGLPTDPGLVWASHFNEGAGVVAANYATTGPVYDGILEGTATWGPGLIAGGGPVIKPYIADAPIGITPPDAPVGLTATYNAGPKTITVTWTPGTIPGSRIGIWLQGRAGSIHNQLATTEDIAALALSISQVKAAKGVTLNLSQLKGMFNIQACACDNYGQLSPLTKLISNIKVT